jgi:hypothetical protein
MLSLLFNQRLIKINLYEKRKAIDGNKADDLIRMNIPTKNSFINLIDSLSLLSLK